MRLMHSDAWIAYDPITTAIVLPTTQPINEGLQYRGEVVATSSQYYIYTLTDPNARQLDFQLDVRNGDALVYVSYSPPSGSLNYPTTEIFDASSFGLDFNTATIYRPAVGKYVVLVASSLTAYNSTFYLTALRFNGVYDTVVELNTARTFYALATPFEPQTISF